MKWTETLAYILMGMGLGVVIIAAGILIVDLVWKGYTRAKEWAAKNKAARNRIGRHSQSVTNSHIGGSVTQINGDGQ